MSDGMRALRVRVDRHELLVVVCAVACLVLATAPGADAKGPETMLRNGDVHYRLNSLGHGASLTEWSRTGTLLRYEPVPGWWAFPVAHGRARGLSADGSVLVLVQWPSPALAQRTESLFVVIDTRRMQLARVLRLPGRLSFAGISTDGRRLTLHERTAGGMRSRVCELRTGRLLPLRGR